MLVALAGGGGKGKGVSQRQGKTALTHAAGQQSPSAVVASQGVSSLDGATALEWMRTRLPEAAQLVSTGSTTAQPISISSEEPLGAFEEDTSEDQTEAATTGAVQGMEPVEQPIDALEDNASADQTEEEEATGALQAAEAVEQPLADPEQFGAEDPALLETESPVQLQGFELALEEPRTESSQLEAEDIETATALMQAQHTDVSEQARDSEDSTIALADPVAADSMGQGVMQAPDQSEKLELSSGTADKAVAPATEEPQQPAEAAEEAAETPLSSQEENVQGPVDAVLTETAMPSSNADVVEGGLHTDEPPADTQLPQQAEMAALQEEVRFCRQESCGTVTLDHLPYI